MNRQEEYWDLIRELDQASSALEGTAGRAKDRTRRRRSGRRWGISLGGLAGVCAAFVVAVNALPTFALACANIPVLRELAAAVSFSPSLSAALEHDYVQYVGQSQTADGITLTLEYIIADEQQMVVFYRVTGSSESCDATCVLKNESGTHLQGYAVTSSSPSGSLHRFEVHFIDLTPPESMTLDLQLREIREDGTRHQLDQTFSFSLRLDPNKTAPPVILPVEQWIELDGQRLLVDRLELTPTRTVLLLDDDPANTAWLQSLDFYFTDGEGNVYDRTDGSLGASGRGDCAGFYTYYHESLYFVEDKDQLTLNITGASWLDKGVPTVTVDLTDGSVTGPLPDTVTGVTVTQEHFTDLGLQTVLWLDVMGDRSPLALDYRDPEGGEHTFSSFGASPSVREENGDLRPARFNYILEDYPWDTVELTLNYTLMSNLDLPLSIPLG